MKTALLAFLLIVTCARAELPLMTPTRVIKGEDVGGDYTSAMIVEADGKQVFVKALGSKLYPDPDPKGGPPHMVRLTRYGNFEADILAKELFTLADVLCPGARVVRLPADSEPARQLGQHVLAMEFVDSEFARGAEIQDGYWPGSDRADVDGFINMALVDIVMANADRRDPNYFCAKMRDGMIRPIPIDNNSGFCTFLTWTRASNLVNFWPSYDGIGQGWPWDMVGTIGNVVIRGGEVHHVHERVLDDPRFRARALALARQLATRVTDAEVDRMCALVPPEVIPADVEVTYAADLAAQLSVPAVKKYVPDLQPLKGSALFQRRMAEINAGLKWRRAHLVEALTRYFERQGGAVMR